MDKTIEQLKEENARLRGTLTMIQAYCVHWIFMSPVDKALKAVKLVNSIENFIWKIETTEQTVYEANGNTLFVNL